MPDKNNLKYLIQLSDDPSWEIRKDVLAELAKYGVALERILADKNLELSEAQLKIITPLFIKNRRTYLKNNWETIFTISDEFIQLEQALDLIIKFQYGLAYSKQLSGNLDSLANEFKELYPDGNELELSNFLFEIKNLHGTDNDYYNPLNSNLIHVLENKKGIPISLALIYILIGHRLGLRIEGCNFPGHFLAKTFQNDEMVLIDCHNGGRLIYERDLPLVAEESIETVVKIIRSKTYSNQIIRRVLNNLVNAYTQDQNKEVADFFKMLIAITPL